MRHHAKYIPFFIHYLGEDREVWKKHDVNELIQTSTLDIPLLIDQGSEDPFLEKELNFELFKKTCKRENQELKARLQDGYDHSYNFISTFMNEHIQHHSQALST